MSLRITQSMLFSRSLLDIRNATYGRVRLQEEVASGRRVNRPSDDPAATLRIMPLRAEVRDLEQLLDNTALARESLTTGSAGLEDASSIMQRLRELTIQGANGARSQSDRDSIAEEIDQLSRQILGIANSQQGGRYLFGGTRTRTSPFELVDDEGGTRVRYRGDQNRMQIEVAPDVDTAIGVPGDQIFQHRTRTATTFAGGNTGARPSGASDSGVGFGRLLVEFDSLSIPAGSTGIVAGTGATTALGNLTYTVAGGAISINGGPPTAIAAGSFSYPVGSGGSVSLDLTAPISPASGTLTANASLSVDGGTSETVVTAFGPGAEVQVRNSFDGTVLNVAVDQLSRTGAERVTFPGTFDVFTVTFAIRDTLRNSEGLSLADQSARLTALLGEIDSAHDAVLNGVRDLGGRTEQMTLLTNRVEGLVLTNRESLSLAEDTDIAQSILEMTRQELTYEASLRVGAQVVQTTLLDYLR